MGLGFHYVHPSSAITYLRQTINFVRRFYDSCPHLMVGQEFSKDHPLRNGRYYIVKNSLFPATQIIETYEKLLEEYTELVRRDRKNKLFGEPDKFYRILNPGEYRDDVNLKNVEMGIETREHLLDWPRFKKFLLDEIATRKNIKVFTESRVQEINYLYRGACYEIHIESLVSIYKWQAEFVVNATWEWVDYFNTRVGHYRLPEEIRTNRAKTLVKIKLPDELKEKNSMFFCMGPHCMFSNIGGGYGLITYAPETNLQNSTDLIPAKNYLDIINGHMSNKKQLKIAKNIVLGVSDYIPAMVNAEIIEVRFGTVQVEGKADIFDRSSRMHERDYMGIKYLEDGFVSLSCMKLLYGDGNAKIITTFFRDFERRILPISEQIKDLISNKFKTDTEIENKTTLKRLLLTGLCFAMFKRARPVYERISSMVPVEKFCSAFFMKNDLNKEFAKKNVIEFLVDQRRKKIRDKISKAFEIRNEIIETTKLDNELLLDKCWLWFTDYTQIKVSEEQYYPNEGKSEFYFVKRIPDSEKIVDYVGPSVARHTYP